jgi:hypothetical protein
MLTRVMAIASIRWVLTVALCAWAGHVGTQHATPIDLALPLVCGVLAAVALSSHVSLTLAVPLLILAENVFFDELTRLMTFGVIVGATFAIGVIFLARRPADEVPRALAAVLTIGALILLRWIPFSEILLLREIVLIALCVAVAEILGRTPLAVVVAVALGLFTPAYPLRTLAVPLCMILVAAVARLLGAPRLRLTWVSAMTLGFGMLFFAWSGVLARSTPFVLQRAAPGLPRHTVNYALSGSETQVIEVPETATALIVSGANVVRLRSGAVLGTLEPGGRKIHIRDAADWGAMRRDTWYGSRNPFPRDSAGRVRGYGYTSWLDGAGRISLPSGVRSIRVTGDASLPPGASLQVEAFELR